jgi:predicted house-cleaning noncanonical NTP pyrophosphatase (MazG superfamily)
VIARTTFFPRRFPISRGSALRLEPDVGALRDREFLDQVAEASAGTGCHVEFEGSLLSHAYATLQRKGVPVRAATSRSQGERLRFNKLVRDPVPSQIERRGERVTTLRVPQHVERLLLQKLVEEVVEVRLVRNPEVRLEELADVVEVVLSLARAAGQGPDELWTIVEEKRSRRGGFEMRVLLVNTYLSPVSEAAGKSSPSTAASTDATDRVDEKPLGEVDAAGDVHVVIPLATAVMGAEEQRFAIDVGAGNLVDVTYFADRVERAIRRGYEDQIAGQLSLPL